MVSYMEDASMVSSVQNVSQRPSYKSTAIGISALVGAAAGLAIDTHNNRKVQKSTDVDLNA